MKIDKIYIEHYRSIENLQIEPNQFNVFVGQNNHGKTNFFEALEWFFVGTRKNEPFLDICHLKNQSKNPRVRITFSGVQGAADMMRHEANKTKIKNVISASDVVTIERYGNEKQRSFEVDGKKVSTGTGFDAALNDFLPKWEYVNARKFFDEVGKFGKSTPVGIMLAGVLEAILEGDQKYKDFQAKFQELFQDENSQMRIELNKIGGKVQIYLAKQFPDCSSVKFNISEPLFEDFLKNFDTVVHDGVETTASEKGDGMQRALMLAIIKTYADFRRQQDDVGKSFLFLIDEAELHLHPTAQRALKNALIDLASQGDQVFINTHSSVLVTDDHEQQNIYKVEKENFITKAEKIDNATDKLGVIFDLLGGSPADLLLPSNFLIVEGQSEYHFVTGVIKHFYQEQKPIQIIYASGDYLQQHRSFAALHKVYNPLWLRPVYKDTTVILGDKPRTTDHVQQLEHFKQSYPNLCHEPNQLFVLSTHSLEEYYPHPWKKTAEEVSSMSGKSEKILLAKDCSANITKEQFETTMPEIFNALKRCWELAY